jgi:hypothetical protein
VCKQLQSTELKEFLEINKKSGSTNDERRGAVSEWVAER